MGALFAIAMVVNMGMWLERFVIVVTSLHRDFMPSAWGMYYPTRWDFFTFFGTIGLFLFAGVPVHPLPAADFDFRNARHWWQRRGEESGRLIASRRFIFVR